MIQPLSDQIYAACAKARFISASEDGSRKIAASVKAQMMQSRRFFVDEEVTRAATELGIQHPDILKTMLSRARLPFENCWIEWDNRAFLDEGGQTPDSDAADRVGCFVERLDKDEPIYRLTTVAAISAINRCMVSPLSVVYDLTAPISVQHLATQRLIAQSSRLPEEFVKATLVGSAYLATGDADDEVVEHRRTICDELTQHAANVFSRTAALTLVGTGSWEALQRKLSSENLETVMRGNLIESAGTWRFVVALLALINSRDYIDSERTERQGKSRWVSGSVVPYLDHWMVSIKLPRKIVTQRLIREFAAAIPKRRHEVIGHFKQSRTKGLPDCEHVYVNETATREVCVAEGCGHKRWWVSEFMRGDATVGIITKDRLVERE